MLTGDADPSVPSTERREEVADDHRAPGLHDFRALAHRERRDATGRYVAEGARFVHAALRTRTPIDGALVCPALLDRGSGGAAAVLRARGVPIREVTQTEFGSVSTADTPSGVAMIAHQRWDAPRRPSGREAPVWLACGSIRSPGNLGTMLRTALAAGAAGALLLDPATDPHHPTAVRASMGAVFALPLSRMTPAHLGAWKRRAGALVVGTSAEARRDFREVPRRRPTVLVLGCERQGMSRAERGVCDLMVSIPMAPDCDSLNVGVAAGIVLFAVRHPCRART